MSETITLTAEPRERSGKGPARSLRRTGKIPAIVYGGKSEPMKIALISREVDRELRNNPRFFSSVCEIEIGGEKHRAVPREAQLHPVNDLPLHMDLIRVSRGSTITVEVPVHFLNEERCAGLKRGGTLNIVRHEIELTCPVENIPPRIDVDLARFDIGDSVHISHVTLPSDVQLTITDRDFTICSIVGRGPAGGAEEEGEEEGGEAG